MADWPVAETLERLDAAGIPCGPLNDIAAVLDDAQVRERNMLVTVEDPEAGALTLSRQPGEALRGRGSADARAGAGVGCRPRGAPRRTRPRVGAVRAVCLFTGSSPGASPRYADAAAMLGTKLATRGLTLVYGGANVGLMGKLAGRGAGGRR